MQDYSTPVNKYTVSVYPLIDQRIRHPGNFQLLLDILGFRHFEVRYSGTHPTDSELNTSLLVVAWQPKFLYGYGKGLGHHKVGQ